MPFSNLPRSAFVDSGEPAFAHERDYRGLQNQPPQYSSFVESNEVGRKTFFWYRVYCGVLVALNAVVTVFGLAMTYYKPGETAREAEEMAIMGVFYAIFGAIFFALYVFALLLPEKPYNWVFGIVMIAIGMTSCCLWPAVIPLLIYWIKPETRAFFGRN